MKRWTIVMCDDDEREVETTLVLQSDGSIIFEAPWGTFAGHWDGECVEWVIDPDISTMDMVEDQLARDA